MFSQYFEAKLMKNEHFWAYFLMLVDIKTLVQHLSKLKKNNFKYKELFKKLVKILTLKKYFLNFLCYFYCFTYRMF